MASLPAADRLHAIMAGSGNPYAVLSPVRKQLIRSLHDGLSLDELASTYNMSLAQTRNELEALADASLVRCNRDECVPSFFIAGADETDACVEMAYHVGSELAGFLLSRWDMLIAQYQETELCASHPFEETAFLLVGDLILDVGLLDALAQERSLMPGPPHRPSPEHPNARYYFWMIEGDPDQTGWYGARSIDLPWEPWTHVSFGRYWIDGSPNEARDAHYFRVMSLIEESDVKSPGDLAQRLSVPLIGSEDYAKWSAVSSHLASEIVNVYLAVEEELRTFFRTLKAADESGSAFPEFFCWFDHVAYAAAIDCLAGNSVLTIPESGFLAAVYP